jgi:hypothetical protein
MSLLALSVWDPYATLLAIGAKVYETRSWAPPMSVIGKRIAIHAGLSQEGLRILAADQSLQRATWTAMHAAGRDTAQCWHPGCVLAVGTLGFQISTGSISATVGSGVPPQEFQFGDWSPGRYAWKMMDMVALSRPIPLIGRQGLFTVPFDIETEISAQMP